MRGEELSACYSGLMQRVLTAPRFAKTEHGGDDDLEVKDCVLDVLLAVVESTWPSVTRVRSPDLMVCFSLLLFFFCLYASFYSLLFFLLSLGSIVYFCHLFWEWRIRVAALAR